MSASNDGRRMLYSGQSLRLPAGDAERPQIGEIARPAGRRDDHGADQSHGHVQHGDDEGDAEEVGHGTDPAVRHGARRRQSGRETM